MSLLSLKYSSFLETTHIFHQWISYFTAFSNKFLKTLMQRIQRRCLKRRQWNYRLLWIPAFKFYVEVFIVNGAIINIRFVVKQ